MTTEEDNVEKTFIKGQLTIEEAIENVRAEDFTDYIIVGVKVREHKITHQVEAAQFKTITSLEDVPGVVSQVGKKLMEHYEFLALEKEGR